MELLESKLCNIFVLELLRVYFSFLIDDEVAVVILGRYPLEFEGGVGQFEGEDALVVDLLADDRIHPDKRFPTVINYKVFDILWLKAKVVV